MTTLATPDVLIYNAEREKGYVEGGGKDHRSGNVTKFGEWIGFNGVAWCLIFASYEYDQSGLTFLHGVQLPKGVASCEIAMEWAQKMGIWVPLGRGGFQRGDLILFDEHALTGKGPRGHAGHAGLLVHPNARDANTIEGNTQPTSRGDQRNGGGVYEKVRPLSMMLGVIRPPWPQPAPPPPKKAAPVWPGRSLLLTTPHMKGGDVKMIQSKINAFNGKQVVKVTGEYGPVTADQVGWWQHAFGLKQDKVVGRATWDEFFRR